MDASKTEAIEGEIDRIIERRARERRDANAVEELWKESVERHSEKCRRENRAAWHAHHVTMREIHSRLAQEHGAKAEALEAG